uniref:Uncharacterized protein n=1 Tax=Lygus hesperus TaxID=30085 RepID=A0A146LAP9_LYGHE
MHSDRNTNAPFYISAPFASASMSTSLDHNTTATTIDNNNNNMFNNNNNNDNNFSKTNGSNNKYNSSGDINSYFNTRNSITTPTEVGSGVCTTYGGPATNMTAYNCVIGMSGNNDNAPGIFANTQHALQARNGNRYGNAYNNHMSNTSTDAGYNKSITDNPYFANNHITTNTTTTTNYPGRVAGGRAKLPSYYNLARFVHNNVFYNQQHHASSNNAVPEKTPTIRLVHPITNKVMHIKLNRIYVTMAETRPQIYNDRSLPNDAVSSFFNQPFCNLPGF